MITLASRPKRTDVGIGAIASILYVGNSFLSFNNGIGWHASRLHASVEPAKRLRSTSVAITGGGLDWHDVGSYFRPDAIGAYSFDEANDVVFHDLDKLFDVVVMMDCSQCPIHPRLSARFRVSAKSCSETVRRHGAEPVFLMTWAYADRPEMTARLAEAYTTAGNENEALVIPAGLAFAEAHRQTPDVQLHMDDRSHPTLAGTYLAACTVHAALIPGSPARFGWTAGLDAATAGHLQAVAAATVDQYFRRQRTGEI